MTEAHPFRTAVVPVDPQHPADADLLPAAERLRAGQVVAFPTETVYGLGANALDPDAVRAIFVAKGRPADNPLIVHVASLSELRSVTASLPDLALLLIARFMPGPLTLVLPRAPQVPDAVTAGLDTVAVRMPEHPVARRLIELAGVPVAAPSANRSGRPSPTTAAHVLEDMAGRIPLIVDGGSCEFGVESTVLDVTGAVPVVLRPGAVTIEELRAVAGTVWTAEEAAVRHLASKTAEPAAGASHAPPDGAGILPSESGSRPSESGIQPPGSGSRPSGVPDRPARSAAPRSPGMKYRHYAPGTPLSIAEGDHAEVRARELVRQTLAVLAAGSTPAVFCATETAALLAASLPAGWHIRELGSPAPAISSAGAAAPAADSARGTAPAAFPGHTICLIAHGPRSQARTAASRLFAALRQLDACGADRIIAEGADPAGIGAAYLNRLRKAAGGGPEPLVDAGGGPEPLANAGGGPEPLVIAGSAACPDIDGDGQRRAGSAECPPDQED